MRLVIVATTIIPATSARTKAYFIAFDTERITAAAALGPTLTF
jgi:hypothetical protein